MIRRDEFIRAIGEGDARFNGAVDAALLRIREMEGNHVKKKLTIGLLAAVIAVLALAGAALAAGLNLFERFGRNDGRLAQVAPQAELAGETPVEVGTDELGKTTVEIVNAYYDGRNLIVAYTAEAARRFEPFTPTAAELAKMEKQDDPWGVVELFELGPLDPVQQAYNDAVKAGEPCGYVEYSVFASDQMYAGRDGEIELIPSEGTETTLEDGRKAYLMEFPVNEDQ